MKTSSVTTFPRSGLPADVQAKVDARLAEVPAGKTLIDEIAPEEFLEPDLGNIMAGQVSP